MRNDILASVEDSQLEAEFEAACNDPNGLDCGFEKQRCDVGFANFGYAPDKAAEMREKELALIAAEWEASGVDEPEIDDDGYYIDDDEPLPGLPDEDEEIDRYADHLSLDEDEEDE